MGTLAIRQAAISDPQKYTSPLTRKIGMPTPTICCDSGEINVRAYTYSCVTRVKVKMTTVRMPEREIGTTILTNAPNRVSPSTMAASSNSRGIDLKKPISNQMENGTVTLG